MGSCAATEFNIVNDTQLDAEPNGCALPVGWAGRLPARHRAHLRPGSHGQQCLLPSGRRGAAAAVTATGRGRKQLVERGPFWRGRKGPPEADGKTLVAQA